MKKFFTLLLIAVMLSATALTAAGCQKDDADFTVGIVQFATHGALDKANSGFQTELKRLMEEAGKTVKFSDKNALGQSDAANTISDSFVNLGVDMILAIATPAVTAAVNKARETDIPVMFTAVTDPVYAGFVNSLEVPGKKVSGTSDLSPFLKEKVELMLDLVGEDKKLGIYYTNSEPNSVAQVEMIEDIIDEYDLPFAQVVKRGINEAGDIQTGFTVFAASVDVIYIPTDNMLSSNISAVHVENKKEGNRKPIVCGETDMNNIAGIATLGIDYYALGVQTAKMAFDVLMGNEEITTMAVQQTDSPPELTVNRTAAQEIGFSSSILDQIEAKFSQFEG